MRRGYITILIAVFCLNFLVSFSASGRDTILNYVKDDLSKEWCYLGRTTTVIGIPWTEAKPIQVTYDGSIKTEDDELCFFTGKDMKPIFIRNRTFLDGWMPMVIDSWEEGGLLYSYEAFATEVQPFGYKNAIINLRLSVKNSGTTTQTALLTAANRASGKICRKFTPKNYANVLTSFSMTDRAFFREDSLVYSYPDNVKHFQAPGVPYSKPYTVQDAKITVQATTGLVTYQKKLSPGESFQLDLAMPRVPVTNKEEQDIILGLNYDQQRKDFIKYWNDIFAKVPIFEIPEKRVNDALRGSMVHLMLATRSAGIKKRRQGSGLPYDPLFLNDYFDMRTAYDVYNLPKFVDPNTNWILQKQKKNGNFIDVHNRGRNDVVTSHGQALYSLAGHFLFHPNLEYAKHIYPGLSKGIAFVMKQCSETKHGLLKDSFPYDNEMVQGPYTSHNLIALLGVKTSIVVARALGETEDVEKWTAFYKKYKSDVRRALEVTYKKYGYITPGLYDYTTGDRAMKKFPKQALGHDWENTLLVYPCEVLEGDDPMVKKSLATIRYRKYREGVMTFRTGQHIHQYVTINNAHQYLLSGDSEHALLDYYHILLHNGPTHEGFENGVVPWTREVVAICPPPHAWAAAKIALFGRNMMLVEHGGDAGLEPNKRDLHIFNIIGPSWISKGKKLVIKNAPTEMGLFSATMTFTGKGAKVDLNPQWKHAPRNLVMPIPYFVDIKKITAKGGKIWKDEKFIRMDSNVTSFEIAWNEKPGIHDKTFQDLLTTYRSEFEYLGRCGAEMWLPEHKPKPVLTAEEKAHPATPLSFKLIAKAYSNEYQRRAFLPNIRRIPVVAPAPFSAKERSDIFDVVYPEDEINSKSLAFRHPITTSYSKNAELAVDGRHSDKTQSWRLDIKHNGPAWLTVELTDDLENLIKVGKVIVYTDYNHRKFGYQFVVEGSVDGQLWKPLVDYGKNTKPCTKDGYEISFAPMSMRYIRITFTGNNKTKGVHLVELSVFEK